ncbi:hypothetical protein MRX96_021603 [Rhipicephalus microplus]
MHTVMRVLFRIMKMYSQRLFRPLVGTEGMRCSPGRSPCSGVGSCLCSAYVVWEGARRGPRAPGYPFERVELLPGPAVVIITILRAEVVERRAPGTMLMRPLI